MKQRIVGIDVSKDRLEACRHGDGAARQFRKRGCGRASAFVDGSAGRMRASSSSRRDATIWSWSSSDRGRPALRQGQPAPGQALRRGAWRAGEDRPRGCSDAGADGGGARAAAQPPQGPGAARSRRLGAARRALIKDRTAAKNRAKTLRLALLRRQNAARLRRIDSDLAAIEREIAARIGADEDLAERRRILTSIPGIAEIAAAAIITLAPELGTIGGPQAAKLAGLAPIVRQSGRWQGGKAFIRGGRAALREALYMPALAAMRCNPDLAAFAGRLKAAGKPAKVTITATMRKLLLLANALVRDRRAWEPRMA